MKFKFQSRKLEELYTSEKGAHKYPKPVIDIFFEAMNRIAIAKDEFILRQIGGYHFEKVQNQMSIRLNRQYRLILTKIEDCLVIPDIEKHSSAMEK